eukprot:m.298261 g.298261  ORF g.298261 m.298261 type:complete len:79 (-) comp13819_c0_seq1:2565-2801(-)
MYCLQLFLPLLFLSPSSVLATRPLILLYLLFSLLLHRPCIPCLVLLVLTMIALCSSGFANFCLGLDELLYSDTCPANT